MKLEIGMYVRTDTGQIAKNHGEFYEPSVDIGVGIMEEVNGIWIDNKCIHYIDKKHITKASYDIIDLIEVGDYVNGRLVTDIHNDRIYTFNSYSDDISDKKGFSYMLSSDIKSIVTKEQFENISYKVGE